MPDAPSLPTAETYTAAMRKKANAGNLTGSWEQQELIVRFLGEQDIPGIEQFQLPRTTVHGGRVGAPQQGARSSTDMPEQWSENTARRLEMHTARFRLRLLEARAPHLLDAAA